MIDVIGLLHRYHDAQNAFDMGTVESMFADDAVYTSPALSGELKSKAVIMMAMRRHFAEFSDQVSRDQEIRQINDKTVWSKWRLNAKSAFSGVTIDRQGTETITFDSNGLIVRVEVKDQG